MILLLLLVLLPVAAEAQMRFGPVRLDDTFAGSFYYPQVEQVSDTTLRCTWASLHGGAAMAYGRMLGIGGALLGPQFVLDSANGQYLCPPSVTALPLNTGGNALLIYHS
jgi:hypothetical protein